MRSGQSRDLAHFKTRENTEIAIVFNINDITELRHIRYCRHALLSYLSTLFSVISPDLYLPSKLTEIESKSTIVLVQSSQID